MTNPRYIENEKGGGYYVWAGSCFSDRMFDAQGEALEHMKAGVRNFLTYFLTTKKIVNWPGEPDRINFLLMHMEGEMTLKGGVGVRDLLEGYVLLSDANAIMHRAMFD